jgi:hypothetical protein
MDTVWILLGTIIVLLLIMIICISKAVECLREVLINHQEINESLDTIGQIGLNIDICIRMRHIELLKKIYNEYISEENYEEANHLLHVIQREINELKEFYSN